MNSAPSIDAAPLAAPILPDFNAPMKGDEAGAPFGEMLEQLAALPSPTPAPPVSTPATSVLTEAEANADADPLSALLPEEESDEDEDDKKLPDIVPLICFCPPPEIQVVAPPEGSEIQADAEPKAEGISGGINCLETPGNVAPLAPEPAETDQGSTDLAEAVKPKSSKFSAPKNDSPTAIKLDPELFEVVDSTSDQTALEKAPKPAEITKPEPPPIAHGTVVAQLRNTMKNGDKTAEISSGFEQKAPAREVTRRAVSASARVDTSGLISSAPTRITPEFSVEVPTQIVPVQSLDKIHLVESIRTEVVQLRQRSESLMSLVLKPDNGTELKLELSIARDGTVHAQANCERGDFQNLSSQWPQLQQSLAAHGIQLTNLSNTGNQNQQGSPDQQGNFAGGQNFERGNQSQNRQQQGGTAFEDELAATSFRSTTPKNFKPTAAGASRRWQSWA